MNSLHVCENCGWYDYWFSTCLKYDRMPVTGGHSCDKWESFENPEDEERDILEFVTRNSKPEEFSGEFWYYYRKFFWVLDKIRN